MLGVALVALVTTLGSAASSAPAPVGLPAPPPGIDLQSWELPEDMTWDDYVPVPGYDWATRRVGWCAGGCAAEGSRARVSP